MIRFGRIYVMFDMLRDLCQDPLRETLLTVTTCETRTTRHYPIRHDWDLRVPATFLANAHFSVYHLFARHFPQDQASFLTRGAGSAHKKNRMTISDPNVEEAEGEVG